MKRRLISVLTGILVIAVAGTGSAASDHSSNMHLLANVPIANATDVVFTRDGYAVFVAEGSTRPAGLHIVDVRNPERPKQVGYLPCVGSGYDVGLWHNIAVMSIDQAAANSSTKEQGCNVHGGQGQEGIRLVDISDRSDPREIKFVPTQCGSHTNVTFGWHGRGLVYVQSYNVSTSGPCTSVHGIISVVDITNPAKAKVVATPSVLPADGCHDGTIYGHYAYMACLTEGQIWDIKDPLKPKILSEIRDVPDAIWHSTAVSNDGKIAAYGFESFQAGNASCNGQTSNGRTGAIYFYDVSDPSNPKQLGSFTPPRLITGVCTAHNFTVLPDADTAGHNVLVTAWYNAGVMAVNFDDPSNPTEIAHYIAPNTSTWDANWYRGHVYVGDEGRGLDVFKIDGLPALH
jgi:hypothetical protein